MTSAAFFRAPHWAVDAVNSDLALAARLGGDQPVDVAAWRSTVADACARAARHAAWEDQRQSDGWQSASLSDDDTAAIQAAYTSDLLRRTGVWWMTNPQGGQV